MPKYFKILITLMILSILSGCSFIVLPSATITPISTTVPSVTPLPPTPTLIPTATSTPEPLSLSIQDVLSNCVELSEKKREVVVTGKIFMPEFVIYGSGDWRGMNLNDFMPDDPKILTILIKIGEGPNTLNNVPIFFTERDLVARDINGQEIRHGHLVSVAGHPRVNPNQTNGKCELWVDSLESKTPQEVLIPMDAEIKFLLEKFSIGHFMMEYKTTNCAELAFKKQLVRMKVSVDFWNFPADCTMGSCRIKIKDKTGSMFASFVQSETPNSMVINKDVWGPNSWKIFDSSGEEADKDNLVVIGSLYSDLKGCRLSVYSVESD